MNQLELLDRLRSIAQRGLAYARDPDDRARYRELLALTGGEYAQLAGLPTPEVTERFRREVGHPTPKVGADAAVFTPDGTGLLLIRRADTHTWALPGGWVEVGEHPTATVRREVLEETRLEVTVGEVITVTSQPPSPQGSPHGSVHVLYHCTPTGGQPAPTSEALRVRFCDPATITCWHQAHGDWAAAAMAWWAARATGAAPCCRAAPGAGEGGR